MFSFPDFGDNTLTAEGCSETGPAMHFSNNVFRSE